jgi:hypothetical protein
LRDKTFQESEKELKVLVAEAGADQQVERKTIMSTHGRTGLSRLLMGSVAERVIRHAPCPVFIIHGNSTS